MAEQFIVEVAEVERAASRLRSSGRFRSKPRNLALPDLVLGCLSRDRDIPVDLDLRVGALEASCPDQLVDRTLSFPASQPSSLGRMYEEAQRPAPGPFGFPVTWRKARRAGMWRSKSASS